MAEEARFRIGAVARLTGLSTHVIRIWERRYGALAPSRSGGGARLYSSEDIERLRLLKRAIDHGHAIGQVAELAHAALARLAPPALDQRLDEASSARLCDELLQAVDRFDLAQAERVLARASATFSPRALVLDVLAPALQRIGDAWAKRKLCAASEHVATALIRDQAGALLREYLPMAESETVIAATPAGELHELGALLASVTAAMHGFRVAYLGPNLPAEEIAEATKRSGASVVLLSIVALARRAALREVRALHRLLPARAVLVIGGLRGLEISSELSGVAVAPGNLNALEQWLATRELSETVKLTPRRTPSRPARTRRR